MDLNPRSLDDRLADVRAKAAWDDEHGIDPSRQLDLRNAVLPYLMGLAPAMLLVAVLRAFGVTVWIAWLSACAMASLVKVGMKRYLARPLTDAQVERLRQADRRLLSWDPQHLTWREGLVLGVLPFVAVLIAAAIGLGIDAIRH